MITELRRLQQVVAANETSGIRNDPKDLVRVQLDLALRLTEAKSMSDTLRLCIDAAKNVSGMDAGGVYIVDTVTGDLNLMFSEGLSDEFLRKASRYSADSPNTKLVMQRRPIHFNFLELDVPIDDAPSREGLRATSVFPITDDGKVVGCLNVASRSLNELSPARREALETIVSQVGNSIARARAEEALEESAGRLAQAQALAHLGHWILDPETGAIDGSDELFRIFQINREGASLDTLAGVVHPDDREYFLAHITKSTERGEGFDIEHRLLCNNKVLKYVHAIGETLTDSAGATTQLSGTVQVITARKRAEDLLRIQRDLSLSFSSATSLKEVMKRGLQHALQIEGLDAGGVYLRDPQSEGIELVVHQGMPAEFVDAVSSYSRSSRQARIVFRGKPIHTHYSRLGIELDEVRSQQRLRAISIIPITDEGRVIGALNVASHTHDDISENTRNTLAVMAGWIGTAIVRVQAEEEKDALQELLRHSEKMQAIGQLAGGVAHDFNNQLMGIVGYADMLRDRLEGNSRLAIYADSIILAANRAADLTGQLLAFARKGKFLTVAIDTHRTITEVATLLQHSIDKRIIISQALDATTDVIKGDPTQLQNALLNLALNARDAMPEGGTLTFATEIAEFDRRDCDTSPFEIEPGRFIRISVSDTGEGIDDSAMDRIFEPFFTTKEPGKGTGMGLAAVYGTIKNHRGSISVDSEVGRGTTFNVYLPLIEESPTEAVRSKASVSPRERSAHILLVDDEEAIIEVVRQMLIQTGYRVTTSANGAEAIEIYRDHWKEIDLVILDMVMPKLGGRETFNAMQKINPQVKAILASGYSLDGEAQNILDAGVKAFIQKPHGTVQLAKTIEEVLD